jgi:hypothetical protein
MNSRITIKKKKKKKLKQLASLHRFDEKASFLMLFFFWVGWGKEEYQKKEKEGRPRGPWIIL